MLIVVLLNFVLLKVTALNINPVYNIGDCPPLQSKPNICKQ
jgi:hypothetical protein